VAAVIAQAGDLVGAEVNDLVRRYRLGIVSTSKCAQRAPPVSRERFRRARSSGCRI